MAIKKRRVEDSGALRRRAPESAQSLAEHKQAETALGEVERHLLTVFANVPLVLFAIDKEGIFTLSEGKGLAALRLEPGEVVGRSIFEVYSQAPQILGSIRRALAGETQALTMERLIQALLDGNQTQAIAEAKNSAMPGMDGAELFRQIKIIKPKLPVTIITGYPDGDMMTRALAHGPLGIMKKPFGEQDILPPSTVF